MAQWQDRLSLFTPLAKPEEYHKRIRPGTRGLPQVRGAVQWRTSGTSSASCGQGIELGWRAPYSAWEHYLQFSRTSPKVRLLLSGGDTEEESRRNL